MLEGREFVYVNKISDHVKLVRNKKIEKICRKYHETLTISKNGRQERLLECIFNKYKVMKMRMGEMRRRIVIHHKKEGNYRNRKEKAI